MEILGVEFSRGISNHFFYNNIIRRWNKMSLYNPHCVQQLHYLCCDNDANVQINILDFLSSLFLPYFTLTFISIFYFHFFYSTASFDSSLKTFYFQACKLFLQLLFSTLFPSLKLFRFVNVLSFLFFFYLVFTYFFYFCQSKTFMNIPGLFDV